MNDITYENFIALYPQFSTVVNYLNFSEYQTEASLLLSKYCIKPQYLPVFIYKCIAHLAQLSLNGSVGRVSAGTQGNTNVSLEYPMTQGGAFWNQTPYGAYIYEALIKPASLGGRYAI